MTFPFAVRLVVRDLESLGTRLGVVYTANTLGSIAGAWLVGFVVLPALGVRGAFMLLVLVNLVLGGTLLVLAARGAWRGAIAAAVATIAVAGLWVVPPGLVEASFTRQFGHLLYYREDVTDTVMVTEHDGKRMIRFGDGRGTAGTMTVRDDRMYAHIPMLLHARPERVLSICFGVGNSLAALVTYPSLERVRSVELSPSVVAAAPFFRETNLDVLQNPLVELIVSDGRNYLLTTHETFDVIRLDPPELHTAHVVNLYTREFYELARDHLRPGGIFSVWVNVVMTPEEDLRSLIRTLGTVFPHVSVWHGPLRYSWVINGSMEPLDPDLERLRAMYAIPSVQRDLASIGVPDPYAFLSHFVFGDEGARRFGDDAPLVVDDHTRLDFTVPMSIDAAYGISNANTLSWLVEFMRPERGKSLAVELFFTKIARMQSFKEPVIPVLRHPEASGLGPDELAARIAAPLPAP
jgi:spermidine synthase